MTYTPTDWNEGVAPGISAAQLDRMEAGIDFGHPLIVLDAIGDDDETLLTGARQLILAVVLDIPAKWNTWNCFVHADFAYRHASSFAGISSVSMEIDIDGVMSRFKEPSVDEAAFQWILPGSLSVMSTGLIVTGSVDVELFAQRLSGTAHVRQNYLFAQGVRTS